MYFYYVLLLNYFDWRCQQQKIQREAGGLVSTRRAPHGEGDGPC